MIKVLNNCTTNPHNSDEKYNWGRTINKNNLYKHYNEINCNLTQREGIINILLNNNNNNKQQIITRQKLPHINLFKYNLFNSQYTNIIILNS